MISDSGGRRSRIGVEFSFVESSVLLRGSLLVDIRSVLSNRAFFFDGMHSIFTDTFIGGLLKESIMLGGSHSHRNGSPPDVGCTSMRQCTELTVTDALPTNHHVSRHSGCR